jgi:hypothetical protein
MIITSPVGGDLLVAQGVNPGLRLRHISPILAAFLYPRSREAKMMTKSDDAGILDRVL